MCVVSISDVETVREGHQSEVLLSIADEFPPDRCFTLVFRGRRGNLDLVAESAEEAQSWVNGVRKLIKNLENMDQREKLDQYPSKTCSKGEVILWGYILILALGLEVNKCVFVTGFTACVWLQKLLPNNAVSLVLA